MVVGFIQAGGKCKIALRLLFWYLFLFRSTLTLPPKQGDDYFQVPCGIPGNSDWLSGLFDNLSLV